MAALRPGRSPDLNHGSAKSAPKAPGKQAPMLYTRSRQDGTFEPERNLITKYVGLDVHKDTIAIARRPHVERGRP